MERLYASEVLCIFTLVHEILLIEKLSVLKFNMNFDNHRESSYVDLYLYPREKTNLDTLRVLTLKRREGKDRLRILSY